MVRGFFKLRGGGLGGVLAFVVAAATDAGIVFYGAGFVVGGGLGALVGELVSNSLQESLIRWSRGRTGRNTGFLDQVEQVGR